MIELNQLVINIIVLHYYNDICKCDIRLSFEYSNDIKIKYFICHYDTILGIIIPLIVINHITCLWTGFHFFSTIYGINYLAFLKWPYNHVFSHCFSWNFHQDKHFWNCSRLVAVISCFEFAIVLFHSPRMQILIHLLLIRLMVVINMWGLLSRYHSWFCIHIL